MRYIQRRRSVFHELLLDLQGVYQHEIKHGVVETMSEQEIKQELKASYLDVVEKLNMDISHLTEEMINKTIDEHYQIIKLISFIKPSHELTDNEDVEICYRCIYPDA